MLDNETYARIKQEIAAKEQAETHRHNIELETIYRHDTAQHQVAAEKAASDRAATFDNYVALLACTKEQNAILSRVASALEMLVEMKGEEMD